MKILRGKYKDQEIAEMTIEELKEVFADLEADSFDRICVADEIKRRRDRVNDRNKSIFRHRKW